MRCGIDWASRSHEACVLDDAGQVVGRFSLAHTEGGIAGALARLGRLGAPAELAVAHRRVSCSGGCAPPPAARSGSGPRWSPSSCAPRCGSLRALLAGIADLDRALVASLAEHDKAALLETLPRVGRINLAQIVGEIGPLLEHAPGAEVVAGAAGAAPVTRASGERRGVAFRFACSGQARKALVTFADNSRRAPPWAEATYARARARGKRHPHAIRILARTWLRVIWALWHGGEPYDPGRHGALLRLRAADGLTWATHPPPPTAGGRGGHLPCRGRHRLRQRGARRRAGPQRSLPGPSSWSMPRKPSRRG